ncbi:hypothetical protein RB195_019392 [Necator americanus]|uniref:Uncharacterized protein n=1 Tax=Necator americanus TaxID=51031 RepID=A0ABR1CE00_NECAM
MFRLAVLCSVVALVASQNSRFGNNFFPLTSNQNPLPCGFSCTRQARFAVNIDNQMTTATCTANADPRDRCSGCCQARALAAGLKTTDAAGFPSTMGNDCVCCFYQVCRG